MWADFYTEVMYLSVNIVSVFLYLHYKDQYCVGSFLHCKSCISVSRYLHYKDQYCVGKFSH